MTNDEKRAVLEMAGYTFRRGGTSHWVVDGPSITCMYASDDLGLIINEAYKILAGEVEHA